MVMAEESAPFDLFSFQIPTNGLSAANSVAAIVDKMIVL
jgi:hypothetical protein